MSRASCGCLSAAKAPVVGPLNCPSSEFLHANTDASSYVVAARENGPRPLLAVRLPTLTRHRAGRGVLPAPGAQACFP